MTDYAKSSMLFIKKKSKRNFWFVIYQAPAYVNIMFRKVLLDLRFDIDETLINLAFFETECGINLVSTR